MGGAHECDTCSVHPCYTVILRPQNGPVYLRDYRLDIVQYTGTSVYKNRNQYVKNTVKCTIEQVREQLVALP